MAIKVKLYKAPLFEAVDDARKQELLNAINNAKTFDEFKNAKLAYNKEVSHKKVSDLEPIIIKLWAAKMGPNAIVNETKNVLASIYNSILQAAMAAFGEGSQYVQSINGIDVLTLAVQKFKEGVNSSLANQIDASNVEWNALQESYKAVTNFFTLVNQFETESMSQLNVLLEESKKAEDALASEQSTDNAQQSNEQEQQNNANLQNLQAQVTPENGNLNQ